MISGPHYSVRAFTKLKDLLCNADIIMRNDHRLKPQEIFFELYERGISDEEMYRTFNCGIGFVFGVNKEDVNAVLNRIKEFKADAIGEVYIRSQFSKKEISY